MLNEIFDFLTKALSGSIALALTASFLWGILSVILSPCHLSSIPLLVAYIGGQGKIPVKKAFGLSLMFALGLLITIAIIGIITGLLGRMLGNVGFLGNVFVVIVSLVFFAVGLNFLGIIPSPDFLTNGQPGVKGKGLIPALLMGLLFGIILGPCTFGFMAPILSLVFSTAFKNIIFAVLILLSYALGHCLVIILAGTFTELVQKYINWNEKTSLSIIVKKVFGVILIIVGLYILVSNFRLG